ncbi:GTPase [Microthyrium microscopicum]|uniref:GTPase n=1 Tax=Microthyrium microscopicum TaxID=703497 RepID=A0A6A6URW5_9PEZI|nr:GTPase [Microthyrium microscopicum]
MAASFIPRAIFPTLDNLPRSYFLGHHKSALDKMKRLLSSTDLVLEVRDYRIPLSSRNPLLDEAIEGKKRIIIYTKRDLGSSGSKEEGLRDDIVREWNYPDPVHFVSGGKIPTLKKSAKALISSIQSAARDRDALTPTTMLIIGMPNVGKSTLLNGLRFQGTGNRKKAAITGGQPGITRRISEVVKIISGATEAESVYTRDTPGVFVPYVNDPETMLKLALCNCVKDSIISPVTVADYCLFRMNLIDPLIYANDYKPTNDILELLTTLARKLGRLKEEGVPDLDAAAIWFIQAWRDGKRGKFILDDVSPEALQKRIDEESAAPPSMTQARKIWKHDMLQAARMKASSSDR